MRRSPREALIWPLFFAVTVMWLASGFTVLVDRSNTGALEVFLATMTLEGGLAAYVLNVGRVRFNGDSDGGGR